jgi:hypothetical protein
MRRASSFRQVRGPHLILALLGLLICGATAAAEEMSFRVVSVGDPRGCRGGCPQVIAAEGEITQRTPQAFLNFVQANLGRRNLHAIVFIHSPGGRVMAAMELGRVLRKLGAAAVVARAQSTSIDGLTYFTGARCFSACVYALMGGKKRVIPPQSEVGIHRMFTYEMERDPSGPFMERRRVYDDGGMATALSRYSGMMGISSALVREAEHVSSDTLHIVTPTEMARWHLGSRRF